MFHWYYQHVAIIFTKLLVGLKSAAAANLFSGCHPKNWIFNKRLTYCKSLNFLIKKTQKPPAWFFPSIFFLNNDPMPKNHQKSTSHHYRISIYQVQALVVEHDHEAEKVHCQTQQYEVHKSERLVFFRPSNGFGVVAGTLCLLTFNKKTWKWKWFSKRCKQGSQVFQKKWLPSKQSCRHWRCHHHDPQSPPCVRSQPSNGFRDAAFVWSWLLGVSVKQGSFTWKLHDQELWKNVSTMFHAKKFPEIKVLSKFLPSDARSAPLQTHSPATDSSTPHQKKAAGSSVYWTWASVWNQPVW